MTGIKPIGTIYNGHRFRSRLEAKWAVFFDQMGIVYEYEPQGYVLEDGHCYLPDFYLPGYKMFVEIKPFSIGYEDILKAKIKAERIAISLNKYFLLCYGDPLDNRLEIYGTLHFKNDPIQGNDSVPCWQTAEFIIGAEVMNDDLFTYRKVFDVGIVVANRYSDADFSVSPFKSEQIYNVIPFNTVFSYDRFPREEQEYARQARFEHGERG